MESLRPGFMFRVWRRLVFGVGDLVTSKRPPRVTESEYGPVIPILQPGDVILHRDERYGPTCWFLGGLMVHAGIYVGHGQVIEAVSEGVKRRDVGKILEGDYTIVVRPDLSAIHQFDRAGVIDSAIHRAKEIIGLPYDPLFDFCDSEELDKVRAVRPGNPVPGVSFCCTEIPYYCFSNWRDKLGLYRKRNTSVLVKLLSLVGLHPGEAIVTGDMYVEAYGFKIVWCSSLATPEWAARMGASEAFQAKIWPYWQAKRITGQSIIGVEFGAA